MLIEFESREAASQALAKQVADELQRALEARSQASLVVSGGTSPRRFFEVLREASIDWPRVTIVPSDERWVPTDHPDSNERMIRAELLQGRAAAATLVSLYAPPVESVRERLAQLQRPFACVVLGMGEDGHTASLFPAASRIGEALASSELCLMQQVPGLTSARVSLTIKALLNSERIYLLMFGLPKKAVFEEASQEGPFEKLPIRAILHQKKVPVAVFWAP